MSSALLTSIEELCDRVSICRDDDGALRTLLATIAAGVKFRLKHPTLEARQCARRNQEHKCLEEPAGVVEFMQWEIPYWSSSHMAYSPVHYESALGLMNDEDYARQWRMWKRLPRRIRIAIWDRFLGAGEGAKRQARSGHRNESNLQEFEAREQSREETV